ncbi:hypothetical protein C0991_002530, partial [Blastosporella zonata]
MDSSSIATNASNAQNTEPTSEAPPDNGFVGQPRIAIARYDEFFNQRTFSIDWKKTVKSDQARKSHRKKPVLIVRRWIDKQGQLKKTLVNIMSPKLRDILTTLHGIHVDVSDANPEVDRHILFHSRKHFQERLNEEQCNGALDKDLIFELEAMVALIEEDYGSTTADVNRLISEGRITYDLLWALFPPGCLVYRRHPQLNQHQVMLYGTAEYTPIQNVSHFEIHCAILTNDGTHFGRAVIEATIKTFSGTVRIQDLDFLPLRCHPDHEKIYAHVVSRGAVFSRLNQEIFETSTSSAFEEIWDPRSEEPQLRIFTANGRVMINSESFRMFEPNSSINLRVYQPLEDPNLTDDERRGFALENLTDVKWSNTAFDYLVLEDDKKLVIRALIRQHSNRKNTFDDIISGKGKGLVGLLSGNPGCGKTLTAEAVAEAAQMPLYVVGAGDLGQSAKDVDAKLLRIFELATRWNAVVLLDEADVFLHKRTALALDQNALVAVFLRHLEYYQGVLIMTTNMKENFDPAFESRIHFCMHYPDLNQDSRKIIWKSFIRRVLGDQTGFTEDQYNYIANNELNGRQ